jgi:excisionase family DNA binding protein
VKNELYSVDQVAERLGLHVRTVRNYVRNGRLKAVRIGKQYRIARESLEALTGQPEPAAAGRDTSRRHVEVSSIVEIEAIDPESAGRVSTALMAGAKGEPDPHAPLRIDTIFDPARQRLKVILTGSLGATTSLLKFINAYLQS